MGMGKKVVRKMAALEKSPAHLVLPFLHKVTIEHGGATFKLQDRSEDSAQDPHSTAGSVSWFKVTFHPSEVGKLSNQLAGVGRHCIACIMEL